MTRADDPNDSEELRREIAIQTDRPIFCSRMRLKGLRALGSKPSQRSTAGDEIRESSVAAFCGLGNPESFFSLLRRGGYRLAHTQAFRDHHTYTQSDINRLVQDSSARGAQFLLTTAKDEVKLRSLDFQMPCYSVDISIEIEEANKLETLIAGAVNTPA
jgi:tetraacyldisaccharide 4'-kinase